MDNKTKAIIGAGVGIAGAVLLARYYPQIMQFINLATHPQISTTTTTTTSTSTSTSPPPSSSTSSTTSAPPSSTTSTSPPPSSSSSTSSSTSSTSTTSSTSSTSSTTSTSSSTTSSTSTSGASYSAPTNQLQQQVQCPSCLSCGTCYQLTTQCFSPTQVNVVNNTSSSYGIELQLQLPPSGYCGTSGFYNTAQGIMSAQTSCTLTGYYCNNTSATCFGVLYAYPNDQSPPYEFWYYYYGGHTAPEVDLAPIVTISITNNNCGQNIYVTPIWSYYTNYHYYTVSPGQTLKLQVGNGWAFTVGNADLVNQVNAPNPQVNVYWYNQGVQLLNQQYQLCYTIS